jgi:diguanylate cyclase (GGDEF)-like protein
MSFRSRLTLFFLLIVIVPMVSVAVVLFRLIADNEQGKADARVAQGQTAVIGLYRREVERAGAAAGRVGQDRELAQALRAGNRSAAARRARELLRRQRIRRIAVVRDGRTLVDVGVREATASAVREIVGTGGRRVGRLRVSAVTAGELTRLAREVTGLDVAVQRANRTLSSTLPGIRGRPLPRVGTVEVDGREYRAASFRTRGFGDQDLRVAVLYDTEEISSEIAGGRTLALVILGVFLALAFAFATVVSRSLQAQIGRFLEGARRLGGGDFSTPVPTQGGDEFAALGQEFNHMAAELETRLEELRQERARLQDSIRRIGETFASNLDRDALLQIVVNTTVDAVNAGAGRATARERQGAPLQQRAIAGDVREYGEAIRAVESQAMETGEPAETRHGETSALAHPLRPDDGAVQGLVSIARAGPPFSLDERELFHYLAAQASVSMENVDLHELVQRQAVTDELTGLFNHRRFQEVVDSEVERARRFEQPVGLVMLDIDDFKAVNDTYGHQQGDIVLREVAGVLRASSRDIDEPARYGGEELAVALPQTDLEGTYLLAERVRTAIEALEVPRVDGQGVLRVTASFGVAALPETADGKDVLIAAADAAMYRAKRGGKNRTERAARAPTQSAPAK